MKYIVLVLALIGCEDDPRVVGLLEKGRCTEVCLQKNSDVEFCLPGACVCKDGSNTVIRLKPLPKGK